MVSNAEDEDRVAGILTDLQRWSPARRRRFVGQGPWLIRTGFLGQLAFGSSTHQRIPGLLRRRVPQLAARLVAGSRVDLGVEADAIQVALAGGRVRTFDTATRASRKLVLRDSHYGAGTARELDVRRNILPGTGVKFPLVRWSTSDATHIFFEEELIAGRRFHPSRDRGLIQSGLADPLTSLARAVGVRRAPLADALGPCATSAILGDERDDPIAAHARGLVNANPIVSVIFGHGDLLPSNIAATSNGLTLLDWESAGETLVAFDLLRLWLKYPRVDALLTGARMMVDALETGPIGLADTTALRLALVMAGTHHTVQPAARRRWAAMA